jgi:F-box and WD-40 domain protein CDC4
MEPPRWPPTTRQATPNQRARLLPANHITTDLSPMPKLTTSSQDSQADGYVTPDRRGDMAWEGPGQESRDTSTFQIDLAECVETKTVTTTTTTKRSYPPLFVRPPVSLENLDLKQYPLARKATPEAISSFSYEVNGEVVHFREDRKLPSSSVYHPHLPVLMHNR